MSNVHQRFPSVLFVAFLCAAAVRAKTPQREASSPPTVPVQLEALVVDLDADGYSLTDSESGVAFNIGGGLKVKTGWTKAGANDGFLAIDLNANGTIDNAGELLSTGFTKTNGQPARNGFDALVDFYVSFGNGRNGRLDEQDSVFPRLLLWRDFNHDAISQPGELSPLPDAGIKALNTGYMKLRVLLMNAGNAITWTGSALIVKRGVEFPREIASVRFVR